MRDALRKAVAGFDLVHIHTIWNWVEWMAVQESVKAGVPYVISPRGMLEAGAMRHRHWRKTVAFPCWSGAILDERLSCMPRLPRNTKRLDRLALGVRNVLVPMRLMAC